MRACRLRRGSRAGWKSKWPSEITLAGISVTGVQGSINANGSGTAVGTLQTAGSPKVQLTRSTSGQVSGVCSVSTAMSGATVQGSFTLDAGGLKGKGVVHAGSKEIVDASIAFDASGQATGTGRVNVGSLSMPVRFSVSPSSLDVSGSAPVILARRYPPRIL